MSFKSSLKVLCTNNAIFTSTFTPNIATVLSGDPPYYQHLNYGAQSNFSNLTLKDFTSETGTGTTWISGREYSSNFSLLLPKTSELQSYNILNTDDMLTGNQASKLCGVKAKEIVSNGSYNNLDYRYYKFDMVHRCEGSGGTVGWQSCNTKEAGRFPIFKIIATGSYTVAARNLGGLLILYIQARYSQSNDGSTPLQTKNINKLLFICWYNISDGNSPITCYTYVSIMSTPYNYYCFDDNDGSETSSDYKYFRDMRWQAQLLYTWNVAGVNSSNPNDFVIHTNTSSRWVTQSYVNAGISSDDWRGAYYYNVNNHYFANTSDPRISPWNSAKSLKLNAYFCIYIDVMQT